MAPLDDRPLSSDEAYDPSVKRWNQSLPSPGDTNYAPPRGGDDVAPDCVVGVVEGCLAAAPPMRSPDCPHCLAHRMTAHSIAKLNSELATENMTLKQDLRKLAEVNRKLQNRIATAAGALTAS